MQPSHIEQTLVTLGIISQEQLGTLKLEQQRSSISLVNAIRRLKFVHEDVLLDFLERQFNLARFDLTGFTPPNELLALLTTDFIWKEKALPLFQKNDELAVGLLDPFDVTLLEELRFRTGLFIRPYLVREEDLVKALGECCDRRKTARDGRQIIAEEAVQEGAKPSVIEAVNLLVMQALKVNASDIHIEPQDEKMRIRIRVDGVLKEISPPEAGLTAAFTSRIKIMSNLDIAEKRIPQDGRFNINFGSESLDVRVSSIPTIRGESLVLRLLRQNRQLLTLEELGMAKDKLAIYNRLIQRPSGIILVTGPTGSGKTTTLYASLTQLKTVDRNIITIEDPVEYQLDFCRQIQVNAKVNLTFATGLRSILRHDPDIIMVGEIRDLDTATIAIQAALTGHLVFSTLHTNDAASAITRLVDMGIEPFLIASCLNGVVAQRLIRLLCPKCKKAADKVVFANSPYPDKPIEIFKPVGCQDCLNTGFAGRLGIFEIMELNADIGRLTMQRESSEEIISLCRSKGMKFLSDDGWEKVVQGQTTPQELMRVLGVG
jgi:type II secretory ATPase GspE/PulE/Tfp pilus assembly ATPase PilB-like protein